MDIKAHGSWDLYRPDEMPQGAPANALFSRRLGDGVDWYTYVNDGENFAANSIKLVLTGNIVSAATFDATRLFPGTNATVLEISGSDSIDPQKDFGRKLYDPASKAFRDQPLPDFGPSIPDLLKRIEELEKGKK